MICELIQKIIYLQIINNNEFNNHVIYERQ